MNIAFTIQPVTWHDAQHELIMLRTSVFMQEQNVSPEDEWDNKDETATHFLVMTTEGAAIGCARLLAESDQAVQNNKTIHRNPNIYSNPTIYSNQTIENHFSKAIAPDQTLFHIGRVAVLKNYRRRGIGTQLIQTIINKCLQPLPSSAIYLHAQTSRIKFYQQLGFVIQGDVFMDAGIPHIEMWYKPKT